jgi:hypothetical protein
MFVSSHTPDAWEYEMFHAAQINTATFQFWFLHSLLGVDWTANNASSSPYI